MGPLGPKFTNLGLGGDAQQGPCIMLPNFVDFVDGVTYKKNSINDMTPHTTRRQKDVKTWKRE